MGEGLLLANRRRIGYRLDYMNEQVDRLRQHLCLVDLRDDLTEECDALVKASCLKEYLRVEQNDLMEQGCELGDDIDVDAIGKGILGACLQGRLHGLREYQLAEGFDGATYFLLHLWALIAEKFNEHCESLEAFEILWLGCERLDELLLYRLKTRCQLCL